MGKKMSVILPVYKVEKYLDRCMKSIMCQTMKPDDFEVILVDDGSPAACGSMCDDFAHRYGNVLVIHQENMGAAAARNAGFNASCGEYICFVDSDDYWQPNELGGLMEQVEREQLDVLRYDYQNVRVVDSAHLDDARLESATLVYEVFNPNKSPRYVDKGTEVVDGETYLNTRMGYACYAVMYIFRRNLIVSNDQSPMSNDKCEENSVLFTPGIHFEDVEWLPRMMLKAKRVNSTTTTVYNYLVRQGSITKTQGNVEKIRKNIDDQLTVMQRYSELIEQYPACRWLRNMRSSMAAGVLTTVARSFYRERKAYMRRLQEIDVFPLAIANQGKTYARRARLINLSPALYVELMHLKNQ